jgi:hypothetical protein
LSHDIVLVRITLFVVFLFRSDRAAVLSCHTWIASTIPVSRNRGKVVDRSTLCHGHSNQPGIRFTGTCHWHVSIPIRSISSFVRDETSHDFRSCFHDDIGP